MATRNSRFQESVIRNYYKNRDAISLQKLQEQVTELYLAEGKKRQRYWKTIAGHLTKLGVPQTQIDHWIEQDNPALVAKEIERLMTK